MNSELSPMFTDGYWIGVKDGDRRALALYNRHYSAYQYKDGRERKLFVGPGEKLIMITFQINALFAWRKFISMDDQEGVNCAVFRNESNILSSVLILEAEQIAWRKWPNQRLYTYVNGDKVRSNNPGYCFKRAGWQVCGRTQGGLLVLEKLPTFAEVCVF